MNNEEQKILQRHLQYVISDVFNLPLQEDLLKIHSPTQWEYKNALLPEANIIELRTQASKFLDSELWKIIKGAMQNDAHNRALNKSQTESDIIGAKMEVYLLNQIEQILKHMTQT